MRTTRVDPPNGVEAVEAVGTVVAVGTVMFVPM